ncbi:MULTISPECIES: preprotein translocase subunit SecA [unclassified Xanthomonas]|uniref:preprotein translocase subunit SecA n=1 Tax=unclassified Xanthomonas TaxID=2643310 RepID=UPI000CEF3CAC|nr:MULTISPECIES: preprotein translocase subunit SecA [unclassified Xanthomonas]PPU32360.1 preprotein translocase subunit SecA [Xanthomonas sp. CFBP 7912]RJS04822.1 preprotein translocase subunit SecA [Xanthomonas sp. CFBP 7698]
MSDVRALLTARHIELGDGPYLERIDAKRSVWEERLRTWLARVPRFSQRATRRFVEATNAHEGATKALDDDALRTRLAIEAHRMRHEGFSDERLAMSFALIREASRRTLGMRHHDVQLMAGRTLLQGRLAEMSTGEGKTLAATLAACSAAVTGAATHVVTVNDYLAERDAEHNMPLFDFLGLSVGVVLQDMSIPDRRTAYACNITYVSNKELTFDYLKDMIALGDASRTQQCLREFAGGRVAEAPILRGLHIAIIDEADSVLIDEASTPLIISETLPDDLDPTVYTRAIELARSLEENVDFRRSQHRDLWLTPVGKKRAKELAAEWDGLWRSPMWREEFVQKALSAIHGFQRDQHYILAEGKVQIVDESTGRVMADRTWERGLHQMIECKENCEITGQRRTLAQITYQRFFGRYLMLCGMTGTAQEVASEVKGSYDLSITRIPTHKPTRRARLADTLCRRSEERWQAVASRAFEMASSGRAVLIGTRSVEASEKLSAVFEAQGIAHAVLNARQDAGEADAVAAAGAAGQITVATNMAGRGTDIKLTKEAEAAGGLHVILTEFHESARVDRQLFGRCARQGDPGSTEAIVSVEDDLFQRFAPAAHQLLLGRLVPARLENAHVVRRYVTWLQDRAERHYRQQRVMTQKRDAEWVKSLAFVGKSRR